MEIAHRIRNGDIIAKLKDKISRDLVYNNSLKLIYQGIINIYQQITIIR